MIAAHRVLDPKRARQMAGGLCALAVMTKVPCAGKVKTRLTPLLTAVEAAALSTCFLRDTSEAILLAAETERVIGVAVYTPVGDEDAYRGILPEEFLLVPQRGEPFGERLTFAAEDLFAVGFASICLINSDSPTLPAKIYQEAAHRLAGTGDRVVLGPSDDGGYYLIGLKRPHPEIFQAIDWSTERVFSQTLERAQTIGLAVETLSTWYDVDDHQTLARLFRELFENSLDMSDAYEAPHTRAFLADLMRRDGRRQGLPNES